MKNEGRKVPIKSEERQAFNKARKEMMKIHDCWNCRYFYICNPTKGCKLDTFKAKQHQPKVNLEPIIPLTPQQKLEKRRAYFRDYYHKNYEKNKEKMRARSLSYFQANREEILRKNREYKKEHREQSRLCAKRYREKPEHKEKARAYRLANKERMQQYQKKYRTAHKEKRRQYQREYNARPDIIERTKIRKAAWRDKNRERTHEYWEKYYASKGKEHVHKYYLENRDKILARMKEYHQKKKQKEK